MTKLAAMGQLEAGLFGREEAYCNTAGSCKTLQSQWRAHDKVDRAISK